MTQKKNKSMSEILAWIVAGVATLALVTASIVSLTSRGTHTSQSATQELPANAQQSAVDYMTKLLDSADKSVDSNILKSTDNSQTTELFTKMSQGDFSEVPDSIQKAFTFSDSNNASNASVTMNTKKAGAYTAFLTLWRSRITVKDTTKRSVTPVTTFATVNTTHKYVVIPAESFIGVPIDMQFVLTWDGHTWHIDGDILGNSVVIMLRQSQLTSYATSQSTSTSTSK